MVSKKKSASNSNNRRSSVPITKFKKAISKLRPASKSVSASDSSSATTTESLTQSSIPENSPIIEDIDETLANLDLDDNDISAISDDLEHDDNAQKSSVKRTSNVKVEKLQVFNLSNFREKFDLPQPEMLSLSIDGKKMTLGRK